MTHHGVGEPAMNGTTIETIKQSDLLNSNWYESLSLPQLVAYIRYQFIYLNERVVDWDAPAHARRRPNYDGGKDKFGVNHSSKWAQAARVIGKFSAHPGMWVHSHFSPIASVALTSSTQHIPEIRPSSLYSAKSSEFYVKYCSDLPRILMQKFLLSAHTIKSRTLSVKHFNLSEDARNFYVVCDESYVTAPPFFRHAFAALANCERGVERYLWRAALDYEVHQAVYDNLIETNETDISWWVTDNLRAAVCEIRRHWGAYNAE